MKIRCIAIDDEPLALNKMKNYIGKVPFLDLVATFNNGIDAISFIKDNKVDLMFLDVQMDELTGIQMLETLKERPKVILTTAYDSYALKGYELDVCDYLLKPISFERFLQSVNKIFDLLSNKNHESVKLSSETGQENKKEKFVFIKTEYRMQKVNFDDILYIEGMKDYLLIRTITEKIMTLQNFRKMEELLPPDNFIRTHKSYMVAINKIESIERNRIKIKDKLIPIGDTYKKAFSDFFEKNNLKLQ